jgi:hypothetical protein
MLDRFPEEGLQESERGGGREDVQDVTGIQTIAIFLRRGDGEVQGVSRGESSAPSRSRGRGKRRERQLHLEEAEVDCRGGVLQTPEMSFLCELTGRGEGEGRGDIRGGRGEGGGTCRCDHNKLQLPLFHEVDGHRSSAPSHRRGGVRKQGGGGGGGFDPHEQTSSCLPSLERRRAYS